MSMIRLQSSGFDKARCHNIEFSGLQTQDQPLKEQISATWFAFSEFPIFKKQNKTENPSHFDICLFYIIACYLYNVEY